MTDSLEPEAVEPLLRGRFGRPYRYEAACPSTQLLLDASSPEGAVAVCDEQTEGRGRLGRRWSAPRGTAILCSTLLRPPSERRASELSLVAGMATADAVEQTLAVRAEIKWPNDVMVDGRKLAGVLAEGGEDDVVVGVGINVSQTGAELPAGAATSMRLVGGGALRRAPILALLLERFEAHYDRWCEGGLDSIYDGLVERDFLRGRRVWVDGVSGTAITIARTGGLAIDADGERRIVESGEVRYAR